MKPFFTKRVVTTALIASVLGGGLLAFLTLRSVNAPGASAPDEIGSASHGPKRSVIGLSVEGRQIEAYTFGNGERHIAFVGGIHGGYEWNSVVLAYTFMDYLDANPNVIPAGLTITVIPSANPDGVHKITGKEGRFAITDVRTDVPEGEGRFNAHEVDLNRNFACKWKPESMWRGNVVSAGSAEFSEPESRAIRDFVLKSAPATVVFWHSQSDAVYASECEDGILPQTLDIMEAYSRAAGYPAVDSFDAYEITGDAEGWLASVGIPAITVELKTHETIEWEKNLAGIKALFGYFENRK
ncbi:MAG: M14 family zinc carboxypeptidase [Patescibacteria group bacterium]|nr:M14 family zinc carboxypeptidase [Patescibacteria group bacterium]